MPLEVSVEYWKLCAVVLNPGVLMPSGSRNGEITSAPILGMLVLVLADAR